MNLNYYSWLRFIFPLSRDEKVVGSISTGDFLTLYQPYYQRNYIALAKYQESVVRAAIHLNKYHHHPRSIELLSSLLQKYLADTKQVDVVLLPIPLSSKRQRTRGYNQVTEVVKKMISQESGLVFYDDLLQRTRHTVPQTSLDKAARLKNVNNAFALKDEVNARAILKGKEVVLIDDVVTTGATLGAAKSALLKAEPASVTALALAH